MLPTWGWPSSDMLDSRSEPGYLVAVVRGKFQSIEPSLFSRGRIPLEDLLASETSIGSEL